jgi:hypothetical protein
MLDTLEPTKKSATDTKLDEILQTLRDIGLPERKQVKFPWRQNLRMGCPYYPQFLHISVETRKAPQDSEQMEKRVGELRERNRTNPLVEKSLQGFFPGQWSSATLGSEDCKMHILYFAEPGCVSESLTQSLADSV